MPRDYFAQGRPEIPNYGIVAAGELGMGKTVLSLSYTPSLWPADKPVNRLVIDEEFRTIAYRAQREPFNLVADDPAKLLYTFNYFPTYGDVMTFEDFMTLYRAIKTQDWTWWPHGKPDVLIIDNWGHLQSRYLTWMENKAKAVALAELAGLTRAYHSVLVLKNWNAGDPGWWNMIQNLLTQVFIDVRAAGISWIINSLMKNVWKNFGSRDKDNPATILGQTAIVWKEVTSQADAVWILDRRAAIAGGGNKLLLTPNVTMDFFFPKSSIPGVPPKFAWKDWAQVWEFEKTRAIPNAAAWDTVQQHDQVDSEAVYIERRIAGKQKLLLELVPQYYADGGAMRAALGRIGYDDYDPDQHDVLRAKLIELAAADAANLSTNGKKSS